MDQTQNLRIDQIKLENSLRCITFNHKLLEYKIL